jgi:ferric iron reductase protein FhuF
MTNINYDFLEKQYFFLREEKPEQLFRIEAADLLDKDNAERFISHYGPELKALKPQVAATYFSGWFGAVCAALQYTISHQHAAFDASLHNIAGQLYLFNGRPRWGFLLHDRRGRSVPLKDREAWRDQLLTSFYREQVRPMLETLSAAADIEAGQLWGQIATKLHAAQDLWLRAGLSVWEQQTIVEDFAFLQHELSGDVFGRKRNPFDIEPRRIENPKVPGETCMMKATCCLAYLTDTDHGFCYTCPRMGETERAQRRLKLAETAESAVKK